MKNFIPHVLILGGIGLSTVSCRDTEATTSLSSETNTAFATKKEIITSITNKTILPTYLDLYQKAQELKKRIDALKTGDENALAQAKNAWSAARSPWEKSEGFLYGPVKNEGLDPAVDTWPVDVSAMNAILNSGHPITPDVVSSNPEARGFHLIEFLLWGENGKKTANELTSRQLEYLRAAASDLLNNTTKLYTHWAPTGQNYAQYFLNPSASNPKYKSEQKVLEEIVNGMITIADEVSNGKIEDPLNGNNGNAAPEKEESRFSANSKKDFADNIRSIQNAYLGSYDGVDGKGISEIIRAENIQIDADIRKDIQKAIQEIEAIPGTFSSAIINNRSEVTRAQEACLNLKANLEKKVKPVIMKL